MLYSKWSDSQAHPGIENGGGEARGAVRVILKAAADFACSIKVARANWLKSMST